MKVKHITDKADEWFSAVDEDPDVDWYTGEYIGLSDMIKLSNGNWYRKNECVYLNKEGAILPCCS